ncbi:uncharacterized protein LOC122369562 [Amphibalanus amphitrite]|uniref:uncharacterized protein LOC122369562 n=1 Tax=Amphibalanus amphitrite TaxID=1232801 RepID=UPI001C9274A7|nr:uncharacterized protein LOC122369562 [Amphibalanus amphitrite]XP_043200338.1 uncharacterized protein LOC122369562 [Amphibalanus amphitrite]
MQYAAVLVVAVCLLGYVYGEEKAVEESEAQERLILLRSTFTSIRLSSTTTTVPYSCNITPAAGVACTGRRRRRRSAAKASAVPLAAPESSVPELTASQGVAKTAATSDASGRLFFTVWTTSFSTFISTSSITNFLTTVSYLLGCTAAGMTLLPIC